MRIDLNDINEVYDFITKQGKHTDTKIIDDLTKQEIWSYNGYYYYFDFRQTDHEEHFISKAIMKDH